ncbi:5-hydroxytryptamine receptor 2 [Culex quinquefasciatus]|uniref:5-hydroxytryptamine receptor 2 n=1 Tax=Culex quinquefasciatus TaxID=7176 RepID=B0W9X7_CULQU|nr:5-hydroxytryptamine receptor 2 [Culex quinquefasciatus]|eukprot:XP_001845511.1 5-hydroxytryptamine receptor 2 [Culex quinquefasciatus]
MNKNLIYLNSTFRVGKEWFIFRRSAKTKFMVIKDVGQAASGRYPHFVDQLPTTGSNVGQPANPPYRTTTMTMLDDAIDQRRCCCRRCHYQRRSGQSSYLGSSSSVRRAPPPRPPSLGTSLAKSSADVYDYIFIDSGSPDSYLAAGELGALTVNETLLMLGGNGTVGNGSDLGNGTATGADEPLADVITMAVTSLILGLMILITVIGNVFVIAAIILERNLQNVANYLVASLAVADLLVACLVMPLGAVYEISRGWILGPELCDIWTSCDVLCCTASILHLVAIATDRQVLLIRLMKRPFKLITPAELLFYPLSHRYWAVTNIDYMHSRTSRRVFTMIFLVWFASVIVSLAPQFGWKDPDYLQRIEQQKCMVSQDIAYQIFATCCTFYVPLLVILVLYWKIYQTARRRIHRRRPKAPPAAGNNNQPETVMR